MVPEIRDFDHNENIESRVYICYTNITYDIIYFKRGETHESEKRIWKGNNTNRC